MNLLLLSKGKILMFAHYFSLQYLHFSIIQPVREYSCGKKWLPNIVEFICQVTAKKKVRVCTGGDGANLKYT